MMIEWIATSCFAILAVLVLRAALGKRISANLRYALWALVLVRLLVPVQLFAAPVVRHQVSDVLREESLYVLPMQSFPAEDAPNIQIREDGTISDANSFGYSRLEDGGETIRRYAARVSPLELFGWLWQAGAAVLGIVLLISNLHFAARLRRVRKPLEGARGPIPVYVAEGLPSPCLFGLFRTAVYVTPQAAADPAMLRHVTAHELTHYRHLDHLWSVLRGAALAIHWWNPLVWLAVTLSRRDGELACDESALRQLGDGERKSYGETLLTLVTAKSGPADLLNFATTMTGGHKSLQERIRRIAHKQKFLLSASVAAVLLLAVVVVCAFGAKEADDTETGDWQTAEITIDESGVPHIRYYLENGEKVLEGEPVPAPREWADDSTGGRDNLTALEGFDKEIWAKLVSPNDGWLVACYGRGVAAADTYVYKTVNSGMTWTEVTKPGFWWHIAAVGFLSPERLIVAQRDFNDALCLMTRDGGETWEEMVMPMALPKDYSAQVQDITVDGESVTMWVSSGVGEKWWVMTSHDLGDTWETEEATVYDGLYTGDTEDYPNDTDSSPETSEARTYEEDHPDDVDSALNQLLIALEPEDISGIYGSNDCNVTASEVVPLLKEAALSRLSRFHEYSSFAEEEAWMWSTAVLAGFMENGGTLYMLACDSGSVELAYETADGCTSAFYESNELYALISGAGKALATDALSYTADLDRDGSQERFRVRSDLGGMNWSLQCVKEDGEKIWTDYASTSHAGYNSLFLCSLDGQDYLLRYNPYMGSGICSYQYQLFYLKNGREVVVQEDSLEFDINFGRDFIEHHQFEPRKIASFMDEINALLENSVMLLNTNGDLVYSFVIKGRLYDSLWWLDDDDFTRDDSKSLLENLVLYRNTHIAQAAVPSAGEVFSEITKEDIAIITRKYTAFTTSTALVEAVDALPEVLNAITDWTYDWNVDGWKSPNSAVWVTYTRGDDRGRQTMILEAGTAEGQEMVRVTLEGQATTLQYSENPYSDGTYLTDVPYSYVVYVKDEALYDFVYGLTNN